MFESLVLMPLWLSVSFFFVFGSFYGSFANVLIYRMQKQEALNLFKRSYCPCCFYKIPFYLNIPIFSWFILLGRCRNCKESFSFRYPFIEFLMACLFASLFFCLGWSWFLLEILIFAFGLVVVSFVDLDQMILPDTFTLSGIVFGLLGAWMNPERLFLDSFLGVLLGGGSLLMIAYIYFTLRGKEGLGGGDIKMLAWIGAVLGWKSLFFVIIFSCALGSVVGLSMMLHSNKKTIQTVLPFGPYLATAALVFIFLNQYGIDPMNFFWLIPNY